MSDDHSVYQRSKAGGCPMWMVTFGDAMSLLVTFFVMLITFSNPQEEKLMEMVGAMRGALGVSPVSASVSRDVSSELRMQIRGMSVRRKELSLEQLSSLMPKVQKALNEIGRSRKGFTEPYIMVRMMEEGLAFVIHTEAMFEDGTAEIKSGDDDLWWQIGCLIEDILNEVRIVGIVDSETEVKSSESTTAWGLGIERAVAVQKRLMDACNVKINRFSLGCHLSEGDSEREGDDLPDERVEIIFIGRRMLEDLSPESIIVNDRWR